MVEERLKDILTRMKQLKAQNTTIHKFLSIYENAPPDPEKIDNKMKKYNELFQHFDDLVEELENLDPEYQHLSLEERHAIEDMHHDNIAQYEKIKAVDRGGPSVPSRQHSTLASINTCTRRRLKLPESTLPLFNGEFENWMTFKGEFESMIHSQEDISDVDKLAYLRRAVTGPAFDKIKMLPIIEENYARAWKLLEDTYSNKRLIISRHLNLLLNLPRQESESARGLSKLIDDTRQHSEMLKAMGIELTQEIIVTILENKIPRHTADDWDETIEKGKFPQLDDMLDFLSRRASRLANRDINKSASSNFTQSNYKRPTKRPYAQAFVSASGKKCQYCKQEAHPLFKCEELKTFTPIKRLKVINEGSFCVNCLRDNHQTNDCYSPFNCRICKDRHNTFLHAAITANTIQSGREKGDAPIPTESNEISS